MHFAFVSLGANIDTAYANAIGGAYCFRIQGTVYHQINSLIPEGENSPTFAQIYLCDPEEKLRYRLSLFEGLDSSILEDIRQMLEARSPLVRAFQTAGERYRRNPLEYVGLSVHGNTNPSQRQYSSPTISEVAVLMVDEDETATANRDIVVFRKSGQMERINEIHAAYDPLHYVLMFPRGEQGWHVGIPLQAIRQLDRSDVDQVMNANDVGSPDFARKTMSVLQFYNYMLQVRQGSYIQCFGRLFHTFVVDMYAKIERCRLNFLRHNQAALRTDVYRGMVDALQGDETSTSDAIGRRDSFHRPTPAARGKCTNYTKTRFVSSGLLEDPTSSSLLLATQIGPKSLENFLPVKRQPTDLIWSQGFSTRRQRA